MLDINTLNQLKELKKQIHDSVQRGTGIVKGTQKRFGFVIADEDGQEYLLPQDQMDRVLPGDHIQYVLEKDSRMARSRWPGLKNCCNPNSRALLVPL